MAAFGFPAREPFRSPAATSSAWRDAGRWIPSLCLSGGALFLVARRASGALRFPLTAGDALVCATALVVLAAICRGAAVRGAAASPRFVDLLVRFSPTAAVVAIAWALSLPGTSPAALVTLWCLTAAGEIAWFAWSNLVAPLDGLKKWTAAATPTRRIRQQLTRFSDAAGRDVVEGTAVARFAPGQRTASIHLAFCPPFEHAPEIACGAAGDVAAEVKVVQSLAYAARFDVKLASASAAAIDVPVSFSARCTL